MKMQKIGVWGLGVVGKSVIRFLISRGITPSVLARQCSKDDKDFLEQYSLPFYPEDVLEEFLEIHDCIIPSPGIDLRPYTKYAHKWLCELDIFSKYNTTPCIAITGTIGKTSLTHLLHQVLAHAHQTTILGGNIGTGMLDTIAQSGNYTLLELSSFQLEHSKQFAPDLAVITNIYPNHLDRHGTLREYQQAKFNLLRYQTAQQQALVPLDLYQELTHAFPHRTFSFFSVNIPSFAVPETHIVYYINNGYVIKQTSHTQKKLIATEQFPQISFASNWLILTSILDILSCTSEIITPTHRYELPQHRVSTPYVYQGISFYNDSKSTLMQATLAAVAKIPVKPILLLGGLSKGVDRIQQLPLLKNSIKQLACFGKEAQHLAQAATTIDIPASAHDTLDAAFTNALALAKPGDAILLSPGGSSYDLFADYQERGAYFEELVKKYGAQKY